MSTARQIAGFLVGTRIVDLPPLTLDHAAMIVASTLASAACGTGLESSRIIRAMAEDRGGRADASLWFAGGNKLPVAAAAQVNGVASDAAASDDSDLRNIVHAGTPLTATALALAERTGGNGEAVLRAMVLGYEAAGRISEAVTPGLRGRGFHGCHGAIFAAAVAAGILLDLDADQLGRAIALAATSIGGLATAADTSVAREYHAGLAISLGIDAAMAAQRGYRPEERILEAREGFFAVYGGVDPAAAAAIATKGMGESWDIVTDMAIKLVPGGHPYHALGEAGAKAARAGGIAAADVDRIIVSRPGTTALNGPLHPANLIDMAHSPAYFVAAGVADQSFSWVHASAAKIADPVIHALIDKVTVDPAPVADAARYRQGATVTVVARDGRSSTGTVFIPHGAGALGIAWSDIDAKYRTLMPSSALPAERIEASLEVIHRFREVSDLTELVELLRP